MESHGAPAGERADGSAAFLMIMLFVFIVAVVAWWIAGQPSFQEVMYRINAGR